MPRHDRSTRGVGLGGLYTRFRIQGSRGLGFEGLRFVGGFRV